MTIVRPKELMHLALFLAADAALHLSSLEKKSPLIGILAFDTPYYGLNHTVFTQAAYERVSGLAQKASGAYSLVSSYLPAAAAWNAAASGGNKEDQLAIKDRQAASPSSSSSSTSIPGGFSTSSLWSSVSSKTAEKEKTSSLTTTTTTTSSSSSKWGWGSIALGVGAVVAATGAAVVVNSKMNTSMEWATSHIQFVGILWNNMQLRQR